METKKLQQATTPATATESTAPATAETTKVVEAMEVMQDVKYATANTLKLMAGKFGGGFYVNYLQDEGSKTGHLNLVIVYPDNQYKRIYLAKNTFKMVDADSDGVETAESKGGICTPKLAESLKIGDFRILEKYETPRMPIPSKALWKQIISNYDKIPVVAIGTTDSIDGIYWELFNIASEEGRVDGIRFLVTKEEMEEVAADNGMTLSQLRTELDLMGLFIKDKPQVKGGKVITSSYQFTKKVDGVNVRFYAIKLKLAPVESSCDESLCVEYSEEPLMTDDEKQSKEKKAATPKEQEQPKINVFDMLTTPQNNNPELSKDSQEPETVGESVEASNDEFGEF